MKIEVLELGLIRGRHPLPVENYILEESQLTVFTKKEIQPLITKGLEKLGISEFLTFESFGEIITVDKNNEEVDPKDAHLIKLYITGLTIVTLVAVETLQTWGYDVEIMGFNPNTQEYYSQGIFYK